MTREGFFVVHDIYDDFEQCRIYVCEGDLALDGYDERVPGRAWHRRYETHDTYVNLYPSREAAKAAEALDRELFGMDDQISVQTENQEAECAR